MKKKCMILAGIVAAVVLCAVIVSACLPNFVERIYWEFRILGKTEEEVFAIKGLEVYPSPLSIAKFYTCYSENGDREITVCFDHGFPKAVEITSIRGVDESGNRGEKIPDEFGHYKH